MRVMSWETEAGSGIVADEFNRFRQAKTISLAWVNAVARRGSPFVSNI